MPGDRLRQRTRWGLFTRHSGTYETGLSSVGSWAWRSTSTA
jgi:hypothetical protein